MYIIRKPKGRTVVMEGQTPPTAGSGNTLPAGSIAANVQIMFIAATDNEAMAVRRRIQEALAGIQVIRNTVTLSDVPQPLPTFPK